MLFSTHWTDTMIPGKSQPPLTFSEPQLRKNSCFSEISQKPSCWDDTLLGSFYLKTHFYNIHIQSSARETGQEKVHILEAKVTL